MNVRKIMSVMLVMIAVATALLVIAAPVQKSDQAMDKAGMELCPATLQVQQAADGMVWETVFRHLVSAVQ